MSEETEEFGIYGYDRLVLIQNSHDDDDNDQTESNIDDLTLSDMISGCEQNANVVCCDDSDSQEGNVVRCVDSPDVIEGCGNRVKVEKGDADRELLIQGDADHEFLFQDGKERG